ncbi:MAG TPA: hypothetical protein O0X50_00855 [Methanocorpusculum sp.]|nr:hypothetical protein [Methanocorpusculum sp.]
MEILNLKRTESLVELIKKDTVLMTVPKTDAFIITATQVAA